MKGIIVLDGPDGVGKTTLAEAFKLLYNAKIIHSSWTPELEIHMDKFHIDQVTKAIYHSQTENRIVILDRLWLSDLCYSEVYRKGTNFKGYHNKICDMLENINALNVVCLPSDRIKYKEHFYGLVKKRNEMFHTKMPYIYDAYCYLYWGENTFSFKDEEYASQFSGLCRREDYIRFDLFEWDGNRNVRAFANICIEKLIELKGNET